MKTYLSGMAVLTMPLPSAAAPGDTFTVYPGCNRSLGHWNKPSSDPATWTYIHDGDCGAKHGNEINYRGQPFVPPPETTR